MIGKNAERVLNRAVQIAIGKKHEYLTIEHIFMSLIQEDLIQEIIEGCRGEVEYLQTRLEEYLEREVPKTKKETFESGDAYENPVATLGVQRLIQRALFQIQSSGKTEVEPEDLFIALFQSKDTFALILLNQSGIERLDVLGIVSHGLQSSKNTSESESLDEEEIEAGSVPDHGISNLGDNVEINKATESGGRKSNQGAAAKGQSASSKPQDFLAEYTVNLNKAAEAGKIDPLIGREKELSRIIQTLCRRRKNNPLLVGEAGVGKTALAEGLALRIANKEVPSLLQNSVIYSLDLGSLMAGTKFRGDFEERMKRLLNELQKQRDKGYMPLLYIDEIHTIIGAGAVSGGTLDVANLIKPALSRGDIRVMGSTTYQDYRNVFEKDHALARRFQKIDVIEPSSEEAIQILKGLKANFEKHHFVKYTEEALKSAVELSVKHITDRHLPDKAIDVIDEVGAKVRLDRAKAGQETEEGIVDAAQVEEVIAAIARVPPKSVTTSQKDKLKVLDKDIKQLLFGQDHAIEAVVASIKLARSGLRSGEKPVGSFLFCGPTGVGKTELAKQLSHQMGIPFLRFDMSEYMEKHTVSRLIGAPPGYVGFEQAGMLTDAVLKHPHAVVLLDEIEKAHSDVWNILLQIMDHGTLTDNNGRKADFRNVVLIMTSNVGARDMEKRSLGFDDGHSKTYTKAHKAVEQTFSPEFRNRLDSIIYFNALDPVTIAQVVGKQLLEVESQLGLKNVEIEFSPEVREYLSEKGFDSKLGARPMARLVQELVKKPLANEILFGQLEFGGKVKVEMTVDRNAIATPASSMQSAQKEGEHPFRFVITGRQKNDGDKSGQDSGRVAESTDVSAG